MIEDFTKSLGFLGVDAKNMNYSLVEKNMYKFEDENIDKYWRCFYAFYNKGIKIGFVDGFSKGRIDTLNEISIDCIKKLEEK